MLDQYPFGEPWERDPVGCSRWLLAAMALSSAVTLLLAVGVWRLVT